jgi:tetratricopeptide (TPR) repeat protein
MRKKLALLALTLAFALPLAAHAQSTITVKNPVVDQANALISQGKNQEAIDLLTPYINGNPADGAARLTRGEAFQNLGQFDKSMNDLDAAVVMDSKSWNALGARCYSNYMTKNYQKAIDDCTASVTVAKNGYAARLLVLANRDNNSLDAALAAANAYVAMDPTGSIPLGVRCSVYYTMKNYDAAKTDCTAALAAPNPDFTARNTAGLLAMQASDWPSMEARYTEMLAGQPDNTWGLHQRAIARMNQRNFGGATQDLNQYIAALPQDGDGYYLRAQVENLQGLRSKAKTDAKTAIGLYQKSGDAADAASAQSFLAQLNAAH